MPFDCGRLKRVVRLQLPRARWCGARAATWCLPPEHGLEQSAARSALPDCNALQSGSDPSLVFECTDVAGAILLAATQSLFEDASSCGHEAMLSISPLRLRSAMRIDVAQ